MGPSRSSTTRRARSVAAGGGPRVVTRKVGPWWERSSWPGPISTACRATRAFAPLDATLGVAPGRKQFDVQHAAHQAGHRGPLRDGPDLLGELTGAGSSTARLHELTNTVAEGLSVLDVAPPREEVLARLRLWPRDVAGGRLGSWPLMELSCHSP